MRGREVHGASANGRGIRGAPRQPTTQSDGWRRAEDEGREGRDGAGAGPLSSAVAWAQHGAGWVLAVAAIRAARLRRVAPLFVVV